MQDTKTCTSCREEKPLADFPPRNNRPGLRQPHCRSCARARQADWRSANPEKQRRSYRNASLKRQYGITLEDYERMLAAQEHCCAICGADYPGGKGDFHVDHDHATGEVRALLCHACNVGLGHFGDDPDRLRVAAAYLEAWR